MPTLPWPIYADSALADLCRLCTGRYMPTPTSTAASLNWPDYADSRLAGICRSVTPHQRQPPWLLARHELLDDVGGQQGQTQQFVDHRVVQLFGAGDG
jgi:hypothetical protein